MAEAHWPVGEGDAQAAKLAEWDTSALRTDEINAFLADPQLNDANCFEIYKTKPHKRPIGGKRGDADEDEEQDDEEDDEDDGGEEGCMGEDGIDVFCTASTVRRRSAWIPSSAPISSRPEKEGEEGGIMCCMCLLERCVY